MSDLIDFRTRRRSLGCSGRRTVRVSLSVQPNNSNCPNSPLTLQRGWFWSVGQAHWAVAFIQ